MAERNGSEEDRYPRAPMQAEWDAMSPEERERVVASLPGEVTDAEMSPPEGDRHFQAKVGALDTLRGYFARQRRRVYLAAELPVYYPGARRFAPDLLAVLDTDAHQRDKWMVSAEGKGLDFVLEVHVGGDRKKDAERNVERYASLGIPEYFIYDRGRQQLLGYRLPRPGAQEYVPVVPRDGSHVSERLGLELRLEEGRLRFYSGQDMLLESEEMIARLEQLAEGLQRRADEEARRMEEVQRRAVAAERRASDAERRVAELQAELERLKGGRR
ncbi:MAG TPA: Uma2 family endonuclease [Archangium sp.]|uniref:Uma2 family endonuclease n=1 Tax=Archangium sp. TaxID=1872627 RepID=UPI002EDA386D